MATKTDARDALDSNESSELTAIAVKSLTNLEEKIEAIDWKLWEIYNIVKNYVENNPAGSSAPPFHNHKYPQQTLQVKLQRL